MVVRISSKNKPEEIKKALEKMARTRKKSKNKLADFYGKMPGTFGDGLSYQKK